MKQATRKCRNCKEKFLPRFHGLEKYCWSENCKFLEAMEILKKQKAKQTRQLNQIKKENLDSLKTNSEWKKTLQIIFNKYIRIRDKNEKCISCEMVLKEKCDAGHFYSVGNYPALRFTETNTHAQCVSCNQYRGGNLHEYKINLIKKIGQEELDKLTQNRNTPKKYTIPEIKELIIYYKNKIKIIENK